MKQEKVEDKTETRNGEEDSFSQSIPAISLPKGGGAIRGIGEKFAANPVTGTGSMSVPIATSPGRSSFGPQLSLSYDSGAGNGPFGFGWNLSLPSITRKTDKGLPQYLDGQGSDTDSDLFILSGAEDLVPVYRKDSDGEWVRDDQGDFIIHDEEIDGFHVRRYRPRIEGLFARIERWTSITDYSDIHWRSISGDNILTLYGKDSNSRVTDPKQPGHIFSWLICETRDDKGNAILYKYKAEDGQGIDIRSVNERNRGTGNDIRRTANRYLKRIYYGNHTTLLDTTTKQRPRFLNDDQIQNVDWMFEVVFDYGEHDEGTPTPDEIGPWGFRDDPFSSYRAGFEVRTTRLCRRVLMFHHITDFIVGEEGYDGLVRSTDFTYSHEQDPDSSRNPIYTFLNAVTQNGYKRDGDNYLKRGMPPVEFKYTQPIVQDTVEEVDPESLENLPIGVDGAAYQWTDLHGEGIPGVLTEQADGWYYKRNVSPISDRSVEFSPLEQVASRPNISLASGAQFMDLDGNGQLNLVMLDGPMPGLFEHDKEESWQSFQPFKSRLNRSFRDPNLKFIDLNGDGHADILISEDEAFIWHPSLAEEGFGPSHRVAQALDEETGPRLVFADGTQSIYTADLSGDGLTDLARIRNGEVCYWPNLGYGRFGAKVTMDNAPRFDYPDQFEQSRLRLADIDGSGTIDIIYLHGDGVRLYFNQSGNSWSDAQVLKVYPRVDEIVSIVPTDLLGNGTACLVWSSPLPDHTRRPMRYVNLMGAQKPHLLIKTVNNLGAETHVEYVPSTKFYLQDKRDGKPWITKLPFPVHVVEKVTVTDKWRNTRFATTYSYHHGYFDGVEREFRGFGRVEQIDMETYGEFAAGNSSSPYIADDQTLYQPPIKTVTWFHTGASLDRERVLSQYQQEYFKVTGDFSENKLPEPDLQQSNLTADEWREAMRACKGLPLRQEVYELDVDALENNEQRPNRLFSTGYHNCNIQMLQAKANNQHAVFLVTESEAVSYQYDLNLFDIAAAPDPRISHTLNLNIDEYGNVLQSVAVVYPRIGTHSDATLTDSTKVLINQVQKETHIAYNETRFTNDVDAPNDFENYRLRLPCEVLTYELTGVTKENFYFRLDELQGLRLSKVYQTDGDGIEPADLAYHEIPDRIDLEKRIVEHARMLYFGEDLEAPLDFRKLNALGLPFETYTLALTDPLLTTVFGDKLTTEVREELDNADKSGYLSGDELANRFEGAVTTGQYWIRSGIAGFADDAAEHFYLPERYTDPFGNTTTLEFEERDLFIKSSTDPVENRVSVEKFDYRVLAPRETKDINDNLSEVIFDTLGLPTAVAVKGKGNQADNLIGFENDLLTPDRDARLQFFTGTRADTETIKQFQERQQDQANHWLGNATARHLYYFGETEETLEDGKKIIHWGEHPPSACGIVREEHVAQLGGETSPLQMAFEYSDGGGNVLVSKVQAEPEIEDGPMRWIANGKTILNNKGKPVKQYEPYFTDSHTFEEPIEKGVTPVMYYDAADRLVRTELPDGSFSRVEFSPWHVSSFDPNDTVMDSEWYGRQNPLDPNSPLPTDPMTAEITASSEQRNAWLAAQHANTPTTVFLDSLGRDVISIEHNKFKNQNEPIQEEKFVTFTKLDAEGKPLWIRDARGNLVMQYITPLKPTRAAEESDQGNPENTPDNTAPCYDIAGNLLFQHSMDGGDRWMITDAAGQPFYAWDFNNRITQDGDEINENRIFHTTYDALRRPLEQQLSINAGEWQTTERIIYGEGQEDDKLRNLRGQPYQHYDSSGLMTNQRFDFKGNLLHVKRQLASAYNASVIHWADDPSAETLEDETFNQITEYDALDRMTRNYNWHRGEGSHVAVYEPIYNERSVLKAEDLVVGATKTAAGYEELRPPQGASPGLPRESAIRTTAIAEISYDAKGQRTRFQYGNGTTTRYDYDPETFRLVNLKTIHIENGTLLQDLYYTYDPVGNITEILDKALQTVFFKKAVVKPDCKYEYDALYRLIRAEGREHAVQNNIQRDNKKFIPTTNIPFPNSPEALQRYQEDYQYDSVGNILSMKHAGGDVLRWKRCYQYAKDSNRLLATGKPGDLANPDDPCSLHYVTNPTLSQRYDYDTHGSMLNLNNTDDEFKLRWDYNDMIHHINLGGGGNAFYNYGSNKERSRKRIIRNSGVIEERLYLGGMELFRKLDANGEILEEIETHHLFDGEQRVLIVEDVFKSDAANLPEDTTLFKYQYSNHLGSVGLEVDEKSKIISYEEYHPYGTTAYSANNSDVRTTKKRYKYTGMERDEESGLSYHSARYYLPWLGRWASVDPAGLVDGVNLYQYSRNNPTALKDNTGFDSERDELNAGPFQLTDIKFTGLEAGIGLSFSLQDNPFSNEPLSISVETASLIGQSGFRSKLGIPSLGLKDGTGIYKLNLSEFNIAGDRAQVNLKGGAQLGIGPLTVAFVAYGHATSQLDERIFLSRWREFLQRGLESTQGQVEVFATPRFLGQKLGFFALRASTAGGGKGTSSLRGRVGLGSLSIGRMQGTGTFSVGEFSSGEWTSGDFNLSGRFTVLALPIFYAQGNWSFDMKKGLRTSGYYFGLQLGPIDLNLPNPEPRNLIDKVANTSFEKAYILDAGQRSRNSSGVLSLFKVSPSIGFTSFTGSTIFSVGIATSSSAGGANSSSGPYIGLRFSTSFWTNFYNNPKSGWHKLGTE